MSVCAGMAATLPAVMTGSIRLYVTAALAAGDAIAATAAQAHYLGAVMRRAVGDPVLLFNGRDGEWAARIATVRRDFATLRVERRTHAQTQGPDLWLVFALLKRDATDLVVQKATELGVAALHPVITERTNAHGSMPSAFTAIAIEAAEQCERLTVPDLHPPRRLQRCCRLASRPAPVRRPRTQPGSRRLSPTRWTGRAAGRPGRRLRTGGA